jgi:KDO2-lipid IV(A) lauroyltransferase
MSLGSRLGIGFMRAIAPLPLPLVRGFGALLGRVLHTVAVPRRRVVDTNLALCFPQKSEAERRALVRQVFICFVQAWLDRGWLWHARPEVTKARLRMTGDLAQLAGDEPVVLFAPHFVGLDAGATALSQQVPRRYTTLYAKQSNVVVDEWVKRGRLRFGEVRLFGRFSEMKPIVASLRAGEVLYLLPDMDFGAKDAFFVPFYGVNAATIPSLPRFARLGRAKVVPVLTRMTPAGYDVEVLPAWTDYPTQDVVADTALMNRRLQTYIDTMPEQYFWVHKRFKTRPPGEAEVY